MKKIYLLKIFVFVFLTFILTSCSNSVEQTIYLGNTDVYAPIVAPPTHLITNKAKGHLTVSPKFSIQPESSISGSTENHYTDGCLPSDTNHFQVNNRNLVWHFPKIQAGLDFDFPFASAFGFFGGIQYSNVKQKDLWGGNFGLSLISKEESSVIRFDFGLIYQEYYYNAASIVYTKVKVYNGFEESYKLITDSDKHVNINPFCSFTFNTMNTDIPLNYFFSIGYFTQNLLGFKPGRSYNGLNNTETTDLRADCTAGFLMLNPGISYKFDKQVKFTFGVKLLNETQLNDPSQSWFVVPTFQMDWEL